MDPNAALAELIQAASDWEDVRGQGESLTDAVEAADRMRDAIRSLNDWLTRGGFLPRAWQATRTS